jgi:hypothetical protein
MTDLHTALTAAREALAELEHEQWMGWAQALLDSEASRLTPSRRERWARLMVPYADLTESQKDQDRVWADKSIAAILATHKEGTY